MARRGAASKSSGCLKLSSPTATSRSRVGKRQGAQHDGVDDGEDGGRGADAQRQHGERDERERRRGARAIGTRSRTSRQAASSDVRPDVADRFRRLRHSAERRQRGAPRLGRRQAARDVGVGFLLQVEGELLVGFGVDAPASARCRGRTRSAGQHRASTPRPARHGYSAFEHAPHREREVLPALALGLEPPPAGRGDRVDARAPVVLGRLSSRTGRRRAARADAAPDRATLAGVEPFHATSAGCDSRCPSRDSVPGASTLSSSRSSVPCSRSVFGTESLLSSTRGRYTSTSRRSRGETRRGLSGASLPPCPPFSRWPRPLPWRGTSRSPPSASPAPAGPAESGSCPRPLIS